MSKCSRRDFLKLAGASAAVAVSGSAMAGENPFEFKTLEGGYQQVAAAQGNCGSSMKKDGQGNCGSSMKKDGQGNCGSSMKKDGQGNCGASMKKDGQGNCGASMKKDGHGNCGASMKKDKDQAQEGKCGYKMQ
ncbi:twin-arginine translocation signal domain-containing protein [Hydrogenovibrio sp. JE_KL2]|uniref:twin-arginine translocation signal domain-containing protein n=1 Tax=Hydrogenovibrio sp. JE_KL2 TaxID=2651188 RepID=UPI00128B53BA|nr:twin-arginine translocation signal domain-containing protein [Hydrogenovibrio sp. JE_KL2]MPQ77625.1 twin-arginine translocation signal domain-containing protein [Hydrogenovibrio sp. JE_KL2]